MKDNINDLESRRRVLKLLGQSAVVLPLASLTACGGGDEAPAPAAPAKPAEKAVSAAEEAAAEAEKTMESAMKEAEEAAAEAEETMESAMEEAEDAVEDAMQEAEAAVGGDLPVLSESDPQAQSLGYVQNATGVDAAKYPRYKAGQACANCALYMGGDAAQGACSIFPGKAVKATGWCSVYAPKVG